MPIKPETPTMSEVLRDAIESKVGELHSCMPGIVDSVDHVKKTVDVRLSLKRKYVTDVNPIELPKLVKVPLGFFQTNNAIISVPVAKDDDIWVFFSERSLDAWKNTNQSDSVANRIVSPNDPRMHALSDAIAIPMVKPISTGIESDPVNVLIQNGLGNKLTISPDGAFKFLSASGANLNIDKDAKWLLGNSKQELLDLFSQCLQLLVDARVLTDLGLQPLTNAASFAALKALLDNELSQ